MCGQGSFGCKVAARVSHFQGLVQGQFQGFLGWLGFRFQKGARVQGILVLGFQLGFQVGQDKWAFGFGLANLGSEREFGLRVRCLRNWVQEWFGFDLGRILGDGPRGFGLERKGLVTDWVFGFWILIGLIIIIVIIIILITNFNKYYNNKINNNINNNINTTI